MQFSGNNTAFDFENIFWIKANNYYNGVNDLTRQSGYASQFRIEKTGVLFRRTNSSHSANQIITDWGSWNDILYTEGWKKLVTLNSSNYVRGIIIGKLKILHIHLTDYLAGTNITIGQTLTSITDNNFKPTETRRATGSIDIQGGRVSCVLTITTTGEIRIYPMLQNQYTGTISNIIGIFGDLFFLVD